VKLDFATAKLPYSIGTVERQMREGVRCREFELSIAVGYRVCLMDLR
jgi:hypothetical protein